MSNHGNVMKIERKHKIDIILMYTHILYQTRKDKQIVSGFRIFSSIFT